MPRLVAGRAPNLGQPLMYGGRRGGRHELRPLRSAARTSARITGFIFSTVAVAITSA